MRAARVQPRLRLRLRGGNAAIPPATLSFTVSFRKKKKKNNMSKAVACCAASKGAQVSVSDSELAARGFAVRRSSSGLDVGELNEVFARVGFPRRHEDRLRRALEHSEVVWLEDSAAAAGRPVAFARAAGDGVFNAVVWDVVVEPSCQGLGLGRAVMERLVAELRRKGVSNIALYAGPRVDDSTASSASPWTPTPSGAWPSTAQGNKTLPRPPSPALSS
ncbi:hypothetical protein E2562_020758 [Oryza meyeriana var. granulata]|uniref:N-acetyltransferase domain-containing protein n=1 Tax=Oryza meyeriana var. granulata TaxID=110450 RepID=A0A6G1CH86_9ORYZ|nr:hypothetical protein E2562_020758 [Oryza meyeriana var. granulata]